MDLVWNLISVGNTDWKAIRDDFGMTVIHAAAQDGLLKTVRMCIFKGMDTNIQDFQQDTPLNYLAKGSNCNETFSNVLKLLVQNGANVNARNAIGNNPLFNFINSITVYKNPLFVLAARSGVVAQLQLLEAAGGEWKTLRNIFGHSIIIQWKHNCSPVFYFKGANVNERTASGIVALHSVASCYQNNFAKVRKLLKDSGVNMNAVDEAGYSALMFATLGKSNTYRAAFEHPVRYGCCWDLANGQGQTVLHMLASMGNFNGLSYFITDLHVDPKLLDNHGRSVMHYGAFAACNFIDMIKLFLEKGVDINGLDGNGNSALFYAVAAGRSKFELEFLISRGARLDLRNNHGRSVLHIAGMANNMNALICFALLEQICRRGIALGIVRFESVGI